MLEEKLIWQKDFYGFSGFREILTTKHREKVAKWRKTLKMNLFVFTLNGL
jgi:hypothetical protein